MSSGMGSFSYNKGTDMDHNGPDVALYRPKQYGITTATPDEWRDEAACSGKEVKYFELPDVADDNANHPPLEDLHVLIAEGLKVCSLCPVRAECLKSASELDKFWTTRGGRPPEGLFHDYTPPLKSFSVLSRKEMPLKELCKRQHKNWRQRPNGKRRCLSCDSLTPAQKREWDKAHGIL